MIWAWAGFLLFVGIVLALDLGVFNRKAHAPTMREALIFTTGTIVMAVAFGALVYFAYEAHWLGLGLAADAVDGRVNDGRLAAVKFLTGYVVELSLSMDNVFVIALIFEHLRVPLMYQHRVLFWGILGALVMRGGMILVGAQLVARYHWILYVFGAFLVLTGIRMLFSSVVEKEEEVEGWVTRFLRRHFAVTDRFHEQHFVVELNGKRFLTPLAVALVLVETTDLLFAVDSIPAIFAITADPFLVFTSNVFAILCLRSLYFGLAGLIQKFRYLKVSLALVLAIVGVKMLAGKWIKLWLGEESNHVLLGVIFAVLLGGAAASWWVDRRRSEAWAEREGAAPAPL
ncbi:MAG: TerC/Alx family metal homeostasis membrane protein [Gemmatimonadales bacterium]|nr:TerC/Alx family metal homeostasis membrane protein [Gemmatimonadales bacterium]